MHATRVEIALDVLLELVAIEDDRMRRAVGIRRGVVEREHDALPIGRPRIIVHAILDRRELPRFAAVRGKEPELIRLLLIAARGQKGDRARVADELRGVLILGAPRHSSGRGAIPSCEPDVPVRAIVRSVHRRDGVGDPLAIAGHARIAHIREALHVRDGERAGGSLRTSARRGEETRGRGNDRPRAGAMSHENGDRRTGRGRSSAGLYRAEPRAASQGGRASRKPANPAVRVLLRE